MVDWGGGYPPGAAGDSAAPYNEPDRTDDKFPVWCSKCGFKAEGHEDVYHHKHPKYVFKLEPPTPE